MRNEGKILFQKQKINILLMQNANKEEVCFSISHTLYSTLHNPFPPFCSKLNTFLLPPRICPRGPTILIFCIEILPTAFHMVTLTKIAVHVKLIN